MKSKFSRTLKNDAKKNFQGSELFFEKCWKKMLCQADWFEIKPEEIDGWLQYFANQATYGKTIYTLND